MSEVSSAGRESKTMIWIGRILSGLVIFVFVFTASFGLLKPEMAKQGFAHYNYPEGSMIGILIAEIVCVLIYAIPQTSVLGAILLTGYLGGATATHVRVGEPFFLPVVVGILIWLGLYLRDARLRALVPLRTTK